MRVTIVTGEDAAELQYEINSLLRRTDPKEFVQEIQMGSHSQGSYWSAMIIYGDIPTS